MLRNGVAKAIVAFVFALGIAGCEGEEASTNGTDSNEVAATSGYARGRVTMPDGSPIQTPDAKISLFLQGVNEDTGESIPLSPQVKSDGTYEQKLPPGHYHFSAAMIEVPFEGENYRLDLDPVEDMQAQRPSSEGIVQNFVWRVSGQRPNSDANPEEESDWYGGHVSIQYSIYREDINQAVSLPQPGTKFIFQLTPLGTLIDGTEGEPMTFEQEWTADMSATSMLTLHDVPIGSYELTGEIVHPDGTRMPAVFEESFAQYAPQVEVHFPPNRLSNTTDVVQLAVGGQLD